MSSKKPLRIGTRGSALARWQAEWIAAQLQQQDLDVEIIVIATSGDNQPGPITSAASPGLFTKEIQAALLHEDVDVAVHSLKDLPTQPTAELTLAAIPVRESPWDVLVSSHSKTLDQLDPGARVGTGSPRRKAQLLHIRSDLNILDIRGNVDTRLRKLADGQYDSLVLAEAGLQRLGLQAHITEVFSPDRMLPAVGQGALGVEVRSHDHQSREILAALNDPATVASVTAERTILATLQAGCLAPVATWGRMNADQLIVDAIVLSHDGRQRLFAQATGAATEAKAMGQAVAHELLQQGAASLIADAHPPG